VRLQRESQLGTNAGYQLLEVSVTGTDTAPTPVPPVLTALDRCDRCGAQAYVRVVLPGGGDLMFCRHHARAHGAKLDEVALEIYDESAQLDMSPTRS